MQEISTDLDNQLAELKKLHKLQEPRRDSAPRGLVARVTLRMNNQAVSNDMCWDCGCRERLAICSLCSHWVCDQHRILVGAVNLDDDGRSLGGVNIMCANAGKCDVRQVWVIGALGKGVSILDKGSKGCNKGSKGCDKGSTGGKGKGHQGSSANGWYAT